MSVNERSPKRQRRSYSPPSPAAKLAFVADHPHTPPPSVHMSPSWNAQYSSLQSGGVTFPTPPSTSGYQGSMTGRGMSSDGAPGSGKGTPTDAEEVRKDDDGDVNMGGGANAERRRSNHERSSDATPMAPLPGLFKLLTKPIARQRPHPTQDLLELYDLRGIQASVRRVDPVTGQKVNKLRKSYEGKLKELDLDGRNKATESMHELEGLVDPGWDDITQNGTTLWQEQNPTADTEGPLKHDMLANLDAALAFKPGRLPKDEYSKWNYQLGLNVPPAKAAGPVTTMKEPPRNAASNFLKANTGPMASKSAPSSPANPLKRPDRANKKRSYQDGSFDGYGFDDPTAEDSHDRSAGKRRKTQDPA